MPLYGTEPGELSEPAAPEGEMTLDQPLTPFQTVLGRTPDHVGADIFCEQIGGHFH